jgi:Flp pilus assembly protein TadB
LAAGGLGASAGIAVVFGAVGLSWPLIVIVMPIAGGGAALLVLWHVQNRFRAQFLDIFPDALDLIVRAVRAGLPVLDAMEAAGREIADPVGRVFRSVIDEMRVGVELDEVLEQTALRLRLADFRFFTVCLKLQRRTGGSLAETLTNLSSIIRRRKELRLKARALSAESRTQAIVLSILPFVAGGGIALLNPGYMAILFNDHRGHLILGYAAASLLVGFAVMNGLIKRSLR